MRYAAERKRSAAVLQHPCRRRWPKMRRCSAAAVVDSDVRSTASRSHFSLMWRLIASIHARARMRVTSGSSSGSTSVQTDDEYGRGVAIPSSTHRVADARGTRVSLTVGSDDTHRRVRATIRKNAARMMQSPATVPCSLSSSHSSTRITRPMETSSRTAQLPRSYASVCSWWTERAWVGHRR